MDTTVPDVVDDDKDPPPGLGERTVQFCAAPILVELAALRTLGLEFISSDSLLVSRLEDEVGRARAGCLELARLLGQPPFHRS
eukprot:2498010-Amphidinium_carterae.1